MFAYVLEGEYEWAIKDQPAKRLKAGDTFYEPAMCLHRVSRNPGKTVTRLLVVMLHPRDAKELVIPEKHLTRPVGVSLTAFRLKTVGRRRHDEPSSPPLFPDLLRVRPKIRTAWLAVIAHFFVAVVDHAVTAD